MKIAVAGEENMVSQHFGHCQGFYIYSILNNKVDSRDFIENPGHKPKFLPKFLAEEGISLVISGGMGGKAIEIFEENNIQVLIGIKGEVDNVVQDYLDGKLKNIKQSPCNRHMHQGDCGSH